MKTNWQTKKLGEICDIKTGKKDVNQGNPDGKYPFFTCAREHTYSDDYSFDMEALLVAGNGDVGHVNYYKGKFEAYQRTYILYYFKNISSRFLHLFLDGFLKDKVSKQKLGNTMPYIKMGMLTEFQIPLPPLPEQHRIVKILDEIFADVTKAKENAEKNLQNSKDLFESYLQSVFSNPGKDWEEKKLGDVVITTQGVQIQKSFQLKAPKTGYKRYLYISDFDHEKNLKYVEDIYPKKLVTKDDLIVVNTGASAGKIFRGIDGILSNNLFKVSFSKDILNTDFLYYFVTSSIFRDFQKKIVRGTANPHMGHENFNLTPFNLPKLSQQKTIVKKLDVLSAETRKLEIIYQQKLTDLEELKKSVLKRAFNGDL